MTAAAFVADVITVSAQLASVVTIAGVLALVVRLDAAAVRYQYWRGLLVLCAVLPWLQPRQPTVSAVESFVTTVFPAVAISVRHLIPSSRGASPRAALAKRRRSGSSSR